MNKNILIVFIVLSFFIISTNNLYAGELYELYKMGLNNDINFLFYDVYWNDETEPYLEINHNYNYDYENKMENQIIRIDYSIYDYERNYKKTYNTYRDKLMKEDFAEQLIEEYINIIANNKTKMLLKKLEKEVNNIPEENINYKLLKEKAQIYKGAFLVPPPFFAHFILVIESNTVFKS